MSQFIHAGKFQCFLSFWVVEKYQLLSVQKYLLKQLIKEKCFYQVESSVKSYRWISVHHLNRFRNLPWCDCSCMLKICKYPVSFYTEIQDLIKPSFLEI